MAFILGVLVGLIVGWNFFPQPASIAAKIAKLRGKAPATVANPVVTPAPTYTVDPVVPTTTTYNDPTRL